MSSSNSDFDGFGGPEPKYFRGRNAKMSTDIRSKVSTTSRNSSVLSTNSGPESKYYKMKKLVIAIKEYLQNSTEEIGSLVNRYLQALSVTIDLSIFDPHTNIASEFFVSLYELMNKIEPRSPFTWHCVDVLSNVCRNSAARSALIHTYQFLPSLSRVLGDQISTEKKIRLLKLMQDLTCGIKISWQIPHLPHLMITLAKWVENQDAEIVALSLGVIVNLCYKNLPAIYTLTSNVDMKKLMKICLKMKGPIAEAHACKLLIICDHINEMGPTRVLLKLVGITFTSMKKAFECRDHIVLRQLVEFYIDVEKQNHDQQNDELNEIYEREFRDLLGVLERTIASTNTEEGQGDIYNLGECIALFFQFIHHLVETDMRCLKQFYPKFIQMSLNWVQSDVVSPQSIAILKAIAIRTSLEDTDILKPIGISLPVFLLCLESGSQDDEPSNTQHNKKIAALLELLRVLMKVDHLKSKILIEIKEETICKVFYPLLGDDSPRVRATCSEEAVGLYTHAVALVNELAKNCANWVSIRENLLQQRQIHYIISQALYCGSKEIKGLILEMASLPGFPNHNVAEAMSSMQNLVFLTSPPPAKNSLIMNEISTPVLSVTQVEKLDSLMIKLKDMIANRNFVDISTSDVMELYEYKLASMGHAERAAMASVEAASERCTHLQHRMAQLTAEMNSLHQLLFHTQQRREELVKTKKELEEAVQMWTNSFEAEKGRCKAVQSRLAQEEKKTAKLQEELDDTCKKLTEVVASKDQLEEQQTKLKHLVSKLEENCSRLEKNLLKKEEALKKSTSQNEDLKMRLGDLEQQLMQKNEILENKNEELHEALEDLKVTKQIIDTITKVAQQRK
ncbi:uncharacterized protein LOC123317254 [Coccinella septempunctata]|uniref:uncharacterized protein LOC123317254 n=1 Tax=Coccinella septempunctata TaxID=41139 RepID=UPI001D060228|nr:uncharacterized protein LOC123317254 [Coccinella septempunctata]